MGLLTSACDYFHKLREIFYFSLASSETVERQSGGFLTFLFSKRNIYLFESAARRLQVIHMSLQGTYLQAKVIELCVWLPSSFLAWMLDRKNRRRTTGEMRKLFNLNGIPSRISRGNSSINSLGLLIIVAHKFAGRCYWCAGLGHQLVRECSPPIYIMPGQDDDDRDLY